MTQTDDDRVSDSTETTDLESALVPEVCYARIGEPGECHCQNMYHLHFDSSDNETEVRDQDSTAETFAEKVLKTVLLAEKQRRNNQDDQRKRRSRKTSTIEWLTRNEQQKPQQRRGPNENMGFWAFVANNHLLEAADNSAARPASQLELSKLIQVRAVTQEDQQPPASSDSAHKVIKLGPLESQQRGFKHRHWKKYAIPKNCKQLSTASSSSTRAPAVSDDRGILC